jgi:hypothetical protein
MELLPDPFKDRVVATLEPPPNRPLTIEMMYPNGDGNERLLTFARIARLEVHERFYNERGNNS